MTDLLTPAAIVSTLSQIGRELDIKADEVADLDESHVRLRAAYKSAYARSFMGASGSVDARKYTAEIETEDLALEVELAEQVLRAGRESIKVLRDRLEIGRSLGAVMRMEWANA